MKKRLLSALLALALVFVLLPTTALAGVTTGSDYDISINGTGWKFDTDDSGANIPVYYYANYTFNTDAGYGFRTNDNLMLTKEGNTVTISFRRGTGNKFYSNPVKFTIESKVEGSDISCIEMGNGNNLVITGEGTKGTLTLTRDGKDGIGAALSSKVGDITITGGATVNVTFKKQSTPNVSGHAISVDNHDLIISGEGTTVEATNQSGASQDFSNDATVKVENGRIDVSGGAWLKATNEFSNTSKPYPSDFNNYSYFSCAISGDKDAPCTVSVTGENSCIIASAHNSTKYVNTSMGQAYRWANFKVDGAKIEVGTSSPAQTITDINNIKDHKYAKISVPALQRTSDVLIAGENAVVGQWTDIPAATGTGSYYYDADEKELTLRDVNITHSDGAIVQFMAGAPYIIKLEGTNSIKDVSSFIRVPENAYESLDGISVTISGSGSLEVTARGNAITMLKGDLVFNNTGAITLETNTLDGKAINVNGDISIGDDFNKNLRITADNGDMTFDPTNQYTDYNDLKKYKSITIASKPSETYYNDKAMKYGETRNAGSGTISCDENGVITLNGATDGTLEFRSSADSTLVLEGTNTLSSIVTTQMGLTISGSGSLTVGSIRVTNNDNISADLTITGGAHVTVNRPSEDKPAVEVSGNLTVTGEGTQLSAECTAATNPAIEVGGNVTISGNPGTNAYTVKAYNKYDTPRDRDDKLRPSQMPSAFEISGNLSISGSAQVMAQTDSDGAAVWMPKEKVISVVDASLIAQNSSHNFSTISFGDGSDMGNIYAKGQVNIVAENMLHSSSSLAHRAIKAFIYNHYSTGDSNPYYINVVSEGVQSGGKVTVIPGHCTSTGGYKVTITRGDAYSAPTTISRIIITGLTPPVKGETPVTTGVSLGTGLTVTEVTWGGTFTSDGEFKADESYTAHIKYTVDAGYMLATDAQCQDISAADTVRLNKSESQVEVTFHTGGGSTHQHVEGPWEADTQGGHHIKKCTECGEVMISEEHRYNYTYESPTTHKVNCGVCGVNFVRAHSYTDSYVPTVDGTQHHGKCICGAEETTLRDHVFVNGVCVCGVTQSGGDPTPDVPAAPTGLVGVAPTSENGNGKITGTTAQMEYATSLEGDWTACANDSTDVPAGKYYVRMKKTDNTPAGEAVEVTVPAYSGTGEIEPPTPDNPGTIVIIRPAEEEKPAQQPNPSTGANDLVGLAVAAAVAAALGSAALLRKHD